MKVAIKIQDETTSGDVIYENILEFPSDKITVKQLIESRVEQEINTFVENNQDNFNGLIQPTESEVLLNGYKLKKGTNIDVKKQQNIAIEAFQSNGFFLFINDKQLTELEEEIMITPKTKVGFIKLVQLIGG